MIDFNKALYRRNNAGQPCVWYGVVTPNGILMIYYGILGKTITSEIGNTNRDPKAELKTRINTKRKNGYVFLADVADSNTLPVEEHHVIAYLSTYLAHDRQSSTGAMLPMLAKLYDNKDNKLFKKGNYYIAQPKINGLRCGVGAVRNEGDMFRPIKFTFQSRDGIYWDSLDVLEDYLIHELPSSLINLMVNENYILDGEIYLYGYPVTTINSFVKNTKMPENKLLQFWCYDIAIPDMSQKLRLELLDEFIGDKCICDLNKTSHANNKERLVLLPSYECVSGEEALIYRNDFINSDFEGVIFRDPDAEYQFGKRNSAMWKYKATTDGKFIIIAIVSEGTARSDIPLLILKNDINDATFKAHVNGSFDYQRSILINATNYIGRTTFIEYGERSGVEQVPFHIKTVTIIEE